MAPAVPGADEPAADAAVPACGAPAAVSFDPLIALLARGEPELKALAATARKFRSASLQLSKRTKATSAACAT